MQLGLTRTELREEVGRFLGYGRDYFLYNVSEKDDVNSWIRRGLRQFYSPPPVPGGVKSHEWNFLSPSATLATVVDQVAYALPETTGSLIGDLEFSTEQGKPAVQVLNAQRFEVVKSTNPTRKGRPSYAAVRPATGSDIAPDVPFSWSMDLWPTPDAVYTLKYNYSAIQQDGYETGTVTVSSNVCTISGGAWPSWVIKGSVITIEGAEYKVSSRTSGTVIVLCGGPTISSATPFLVQSDELPGGTQHAETIIASCLAICEAYGDTPASRFRELFIERLAASIAIDSQGVTAQNLGQNLDHSDSPSSFNRFADFDVTVYGNPPGTIS
jgi:hypothetical protein